MPLFSTEQEALSWYEGQERVLTKKFIDTIPWNDIPRHELPPEFIPVVIYMRDVEKFTEMYYRELRNTPTGRDPIVRRFMEKWSTEEDLHGELLNRFLYEAGIPTSDKWYEEAKKNVPLSYKMISTVSQLVSNCFSKQFSAVHMTWGAINELTTLNGYQRLWILAKHPVLEYLLRAIAQEEAVHSFFYWSLAKLKLERSNSGQELAKYLIKKFWLPVGVGAKKLSDANYVVGQLFNGIEGLKTLDSHVTKRIQQLPGLGALTAVTDYIGHVNGGTLTPAT